MSVYVPRGFDEKSKELWRRTQGQLVRQRTWEDSDAPLLERYVGALEIARQARQRILDREAAFARWLDNPGEDDRGPERGWTSWGAQRQLVQHPDVKTMREGLRDAHEYAKELLLTPRARKQNEIDTTPTDVGGGKFGL